MDAESPTAEPTADSTLVVLDPDHPGTALRATLEYLDRHGDLYLLVVFPMAEYEARRRARREAGVTAPYTIDHLEAEARRIAHGVGREWLDPAGAEFEAVGAVGRPRDCVQMAVEERGCTRVFVAAPQRTLWQRLLGVQDLPTTLIRVLPTVVTIVSVDSGVDAPSDPADGDVVDDLVIDSDAMTDK